MEYFFNIQITTIQNQPYQLHWATQYLCGENKILKYILGYIYDPALDQSQNKICNLNLMKVYCIGQ